MRASKPYVPSLLVQKIPALRVKSVTAINTVDKLLREAGEAALAHHDKAVRAVKAQRIPINPLSYAPITRVSSQSISFLPSDSTWRNLFPQRWWRST